MVDFDFNIRSKEHHKRTPDGGALCGVPIRGIMALWEDESMVNCPKCLEVLDNERKEREHEDSPA